MFSKSKSVVKAPEKNHGTTLISQQTIITGNVSFTGEIFIEGIVKGNISAESGILNIAPSGRVEGDISAMHVVVGGRVNGSVYAYEYLELTSTASVTGNVFYRSIEMEKGAQANGRLEHHSEELSDGRSLLGSLNVEDDAILEMDNS